MPLSRATSPASHPSLFENRARLENNQKMCSNGTDRYAEPQVPPRPGGSESAFNEVICMHIRVVKPWTEQ